MIKFGTDGWRGEIARDFTFENLQLVAYATAKYILNSFDTDTPTSVIGYDTRFLSREFAEETAKIFAWKGIKVFLADDIASTPQVSFHTKMKNVQLGIVITASHNPAIYSGFKAKASFGGPATPEQIDALEVELAKIWDNRPEMKFSNLSTYLEAGKIEYFAPADEYIAHLKSKIDFNSINSAGFKVLFDPMYGAGIFTIDKLLPSADEIHAFHNPGFGEIDHPEPIAECLPQLMKKVVDEGYDIGIATDGDADRLGLVDHEGNFVDSHRVFMLILKYLYEVRGERGCVVKTVSLTSMVNDFCNKHGIELFETPVGFKHTAKIMTDGVHNVIVGGEESGGLGTILHIPERDGLFNAFLILEIMAKENKSLKQLCDGLDAEFGPHRYRRVDQRVTQEVKENVLAAAANKPTQLGKYKVTKFDGTDGYKFFVENGWLLIRASGTEPLLRFYAEAESLDKVQELIEAGLNLK